MGDAGFHLGKILICPDSWTVLHGGIIASRRVAEMFFFLLGGRNSKLGIQVCELQFKSLNPIRVRRWPTAGMALPTVLWTYLRGFFSCTSFPEGKKTLAKQPSEHYFCTEGRLFLI